MTQSNRILDFIKICCFLIFLGNGVAHLTGSHSYEFLFGSAAGAIQQTFGIALIAFGLIVLLPISMLRRKPISHVLLIPAVLLMLGSFSSFLKAGSVPEQLIEHSIKLLVPVVFVFALNRRELNQRQLSLQLKVLVALTFIGHAMFAIGVNFVPGGFIQMTTAILPVNETQAHTFLLIIGILDIIFAVLIFFRGMHFAYYYLIGWGILTAVARLWFGLVTNGDSAIDLTYWASNMVYRLPHGLIPLLLFAFARKTSTSGLVTKAAS